MEVTGLVQVAQTSEKTTQKRGVYGAAVSFVNESDPRQVYTDTTDREGRYRIDMSVSHFLGAGSACNSAS